jgi:hypothetical protein
VVDAVRSILSQAFGQPVDLIELVSIEQVEWPDACLGVHLPDVMCAQVVTPGYRVVLSLNGHEYEYHTNADATSIVLASAPQPEAEEAAIVWQEQDEGCSTAVIGLDGLAYGPCDGDLVSAVYASVDRLAELEYFLQTFASFEAETPAGTVIFRGQGEVQPSEAEQRAVAEWARLVFQEARAGRDSAAQGLALAWHREGGLTGICDDLEVYVTGFTYVMDCASQPPAKVGHGFLTSEQLEQLYAWLSEYQTLEHEDFDAMAADGLGIRVLFNGAGEQQGGDDLIQSLQDFADVVRNNILQGQS